MYDPLRGNDSRNLLKILYKISESFKFNEIYTQSTVGCAESNGQLFNLKFEAKVSKIIDFNSHPWPLDYFNVN